MSNFLFKDRDGQTPLPPELQKGLKLKHIQNMGELDEYRAYLEKLDHFEDQSPRVKITATGDKNEKAIHGRTDRKNLNAA